MTNGYMERFNILNTYKDDARQRILLASDKRRHENIVLINIIQKSALSDPEIIEKFKYCIDSLIYTEESPEEVLIATLYRKGFPISKYIQYYQPLLKTRINFIYEYLNKITRYDCLDNRFAHVLVKESQVIIDNNEILFNDLLMLDDTFDTPLAFKEICGAIAQVVSLFLFGETNLPENPDLPKELRGFLRQLHGNEKKYKSIKEIFQDFKTIYLYDLYLDDTNSAFLMRDVRRSARDASERPQPVYRPINAFMGADGHALSETPEVPTDDPFPSDAAFSTAGPKDAGDERIPEASSENGGPKSPEGFDPPGEETFPGDENDGTAEDDPFGDEDLFEGQDPFGDAKDDPDPYEDEEYDSEPFEDEDPFEDEEDSRRPVDLPDKGDDVPEEAPEGVLLGDYLNETLEESDEDTDRDPETPSYDFDKDYTGLFTPVSELDPVPSDPEKRNRKRDGKFLAFILAAALLGIVLTVCSKIDLPFFREAAPHAAFVHERLYDEWIFSMENPANVKAYEWTVAQNGEDVLSGEGDTFRFKETDLGEGEFIVTLRVFDDSDNWSEAYSNSYYNIVNDIDAIDLTPGGEGEKEALDALSMVLPDAGVARDDTVFRNGTHSLRIGGRGGAEEVRLVLDNLAMDNHSVISMWILSDSTEAFTVQLVGMKGPETAFKHRIHFKPSSKNYWELLSISQETDHVDRLEITFSNLSSRIWMDDLDINSYK